MSVIKGKLPSIRAKQKDIFIEFQRLFVAFFIFI